MRLPPYPKYKPSGVEWLGEVPEHWTVDRVKWTTTGTVNGIWGDEPNGVDDLICVRVVDFDRDRFLVVDEPPTLRAVEENQRKGRLLRKSDLLIEKSGGGEKQLVGVVVYFDHDFTAVCSNFVARMPIVPQYCARFWSYAHAALYAGRLNYPAVKQTTGIQNLDSAAYLETRVGIPVEDEQRAIADFLDRETAKIDRLVEKKRTLIKRLKEKRTALISRTVTRGLPPDAARAAGLDPHPKLKPSGVDWLGDVPEHWSALRLKVVTECITKGTTPTTLGHEYTDEGIRFVKVESIDSTFGIDPEMCAFIEAETHALLSRSQLRTGDVLVGIAGAIGRVGIVTDEILPANANQAVGIVRLTSRALPRWVAYCLASDVAQEQFGLEQVQAAQANLSLGDLGNTWMPVPPIAEQSVIVAFLDLETMKIDAMALKVALAIERLQEYRTALITAAVTGKIDARGGVA